jgi:fermentation-respiration switch protein FrsA (DUF1100 family)
VKPLISILACFIGVIVFLFAYVRFYERKGFYFPVKEIVITPQDIGLRFEEVFFTASDGVRLCGWFVANPRAKETILFLHGNAGNISSRLEVIAFFKDLPANVFIIDWRGYGKSQGWPTEQGLYDDALSAYRCLVEERGLAPDSIVIYGKSLGGNIAVDLASKAEIKALICDSAFSSAHDMARIVFPILPAQYFLSVKFDALTKIAKVTCPKLIIHAREDEIVPFRLGKKLFAAAIEPKEFLEVSGDHNQAIFADEETYLDTLRKFLQSL